MAVTSINQALAEIDRQDYEQRVADASKPPEPRRQFQVYVPLPDGVNWFLLCRCESQEALIETVRILTNKESGGPAKVKVEVCHVN